MATAPLGGCSESVVIIKKIDKATATLKASVKFGIYKAQLTPIIAAILFPTTIFHGCAKGLAGTANNNTEDAPIGAIYHALISPNTHQLIREDNAKPNNAPKPQSRRSFNGNTLKLGFSVFSQSSCE